MWAGDMTGSVASLLPKHEDLSLELLRRVGKLVWGCTSAFPHPWGGVESSRSGRDTVSKNKGERVGERTRHQPVVSSHTCTLTHKQTSHAWTCTHRKKKGGEGNFLVLLCEPSLWKWDIDSQIFYSIWINKPQSLLLPVLSLNFFSSVADFSSGKITLSIL